MTVIDDTRHISPRPWCDNSVFRNDILHQGKSQPLYSYIVCVVTKEKISPPESFSLDVFNLADNLGVRLVLI